MSAHPAWPAMIPAAMVGTERQPLPRVAVPAPIDALLQKLPGDSPATALLRTAGVLATCEAAGAQVRTWPEPIPAPAGEDSRAVPPAALHGRLAWALRRGPARLQHECFALLDRAALRLPTTLLPLALELGRHSIALRGPLQSVLGERGLWLARQNSDWRYATGAAAEAPLEQRWTDGNLAQRVALLQAERRRDPASARERLAAVLAELPARERAELLGVLATGLSMDDEPLLDGLCGDRSREVRQVATALLVNLPDSAFARRAIARLQPLLRQEPGRWTIEAPADAPSAEDGVDPVRPKHESLGERAWWLHQWVRQVPLGWWTRHTGLDPAGLLAWALATDWAEAIVRGWRERLAHDPQADWCEALLDAWPGPLLREDATAVLALLPPARRERHWVRQLAAGSVPLVQVLSQVLQACAPGETLSPGLSATLADALLEAARRNAYLTDYPLRGLLPELACVLHPQVLARVDAFPRHADETPSLTETLATTGQVIVLRQALTAL